MGDKPSDTKRYEPPYPVGWICPLCGCVYSPWISYCPNHYVPIGASNTTIPLNKYLKWLEDQEAQNGTDDIGRI